MFDSGFFGGGGGEGMEWDAIFGPAAGWGTYRHGLYREDEWCSSYWVFLALGEQCGLGAGGVIGEPTRPSQLGVGGALKGVLDWCVCGEMLAALFVLECRRITMELEGMDEGFGPFVPGLQNGTGLFPPTRNELERFKPSSTSYESAMSHMFDQTCMAHAANEKLAPYERKGTCWKGMEGKHFTCTHFGGAFLEKKPRKKIGQATVATSNSSQTQEVQPASGELEPVTAEGNVKVSNSMELDSVLVVPSLSSNLLSVSQITEALNCYSSLFDMTSTSQVWGDEAVEPHSVAEPHQESESVSVESSAEPDHDNEDEASAPNKLLKQTRKTILPLLFYRNMKYAATCTRTQHHGVEESIDSR
ncbi:hypothetical protein Tco_0720798 [Tanacetum coccineum]